MHLTCYGPQRSCGKVMFLHLSVILFRGVSQHALGQTPLPGRHIPACTGADTHPLPGRHIPACTGADTPLPGRLTHPGQTPPGRFSPGQTPPSGRRLLLRTVRILLESILVLMAFPLDSLFVYVGLVNVVGRFTSHPRD